MCVSVCVCVLDEYILLRKINERFQSFSIPSCVAASLKILDTVNSPVYE